MHRASPNIYDGELITLTDTVLRDLKRLAGCDGDIAMYLGNGHAVWEAALCNTLSRGDRILALVNGRFGRNWVSMAEQLGIDVVQLDFGDDSPADPDQIESALRADSKNQIKAVIAVQTDTSTSVRNDLVGIRSAIDAASHSALYLVDCIASFACEPFDMREVGADVMVAASQKGLMSPPGVGLVFLSERGWTAHRHADLNTPYWNWGARAKPDEYWQHFFGTAPTHHLFALREALNMLQEEGIEAVWERHCRLAGMVWQAVDRWSEGNALRCQITNPAHRSTAVTTLRITPGKSKALRAWIETHMGVTLGIGLPFSENAPALDDTFRIGHMGHLNEPMLFGTLSALNTGLKALNIAHGNGALDAVSDYLVTYDSQRTAEIRSA
jgi:alanine-glyoxylate transaminase/serine-glyoxylate transaminase/serine-pyruvate transaminase